MTSTMDDDQVHHEVVKFGINVKPLSVLANNAHQQVPSPVLVHIQFLHQLHYEFAQYTDPWSETIMTSGGYLVSRDGSCQLYLTELKSFNLSFSLLSPELSKLGVAQDMHQEIVERIVECAKNVQADRNVALVPIQVEVLRSATIWQCPQCSWELLIQREAALNQRMSRMKRFLVSPATAIRSGDEGGENNTTSSCSVCLEEFVAGALAVRTPCSHDFHEECLATWIKKKPSCPICRFLMPI
ncbi:43kDa postsynaptic protein [Parasponia andersonii]|uniref:43kDa postsynaptic protein n=1 Tax=Parasponia andersonii TaxID=3476 RepID=A0A2P5D2K3_PARAD|nr:43kDa postsynaptic protein [Parasponia andersonii]